VSDKKNLNPPEPSTADRAYSLVKATLSAIPTLGGPATELLALLVTPPLERRRQAWMEDIGKELAGLLSKNLVTPEELSTNDAFVDTVLQASQIAIKTANEEKRNALKNAILNSALPNPPEESLRLMFLSLVEQFTPWHLRLLTPFQNPAEWAQKHGNDFKSIYMQGISGILELAYPELSGRREFYDQVWNDLSQKGLVNTDSLHGTMTSAGLTAKRTSDLGDSFLQFLTSPESTFTEDDA
jgi:hypothetical protein